MIVRGERCALRPRGPACDCGRRVRRRRSGGDRLHLFKFVGSGALLIVGGGPIHKVGASRTTEKHGTPARVARAHISQTRLNAAMLLKRQKRRHFAGVFLQARLRSVSCEQHRRRQCPTQSRSQRDARKVGYPLRSKRPRRAIGCGRRSSDRNRHLSKGRQLYLSLEYSADGAVFGLTLRVPTFLECQCEDDERRH